MNLPLEEISTERLIEELTDRTGGLEAMRELVEVAFDKRLRKEVRGESEETVFSVEDENETKERLSERVS